MAGVVVGQPWPSPGPMTPNQVPAGGQYSGGLNTGVNQASQKKYRSDAGQYLTDAEYQQYSANNQYNTQARQQDLELAGKSQQAQQQAGFQAQQAAQQAKTDTAARQQQAELAAKALAQQAGINTGSMAQQAGINTAARSQSGDIAAQAAARQNEYATGAATQQAGFQTGQTELEARLKGVADERQAKLQADAEARRMAQLQSMIGGLQTSFTSGGGANVPYQNVAAGEDAARNAAFGRAKDTAGETGRAALNSLMDIQGAKGITGSPLGVGQAGGVINEGARQLGDVNREQLIQDLNTARARASEQYQGGITQRGQNMQMQQSLMQPLLGLLGARY